MNLPQTLFPPSCHEKDSLPFSFLLSQSHTSWDLNSPHFYLHGFVPAQRAYAALGCTAKSSVFAAKQVSVLTKTTGAVALDKHLSSHLHIQITLLAKEMSSIRADSVSRL